MGIDKQNIYYTFHYGLPSSVEALYQEAGRAGRWNKSLPENKNKRGICYILHSHETNNTQQSCDEIFTENLDLARIKEIVENVGHRGEDIFRQLYLYINDLPDIDTEFNNIIWIIDKFYRENTTRDISYKEFQNYDDIWIKENIFERYIYRLCLLGIVDDWTRDFKSNFTVKFNTTAPERIIESLTTYIQKYVPDEDVMTNIKVVSHEGCDTLLKKAVWYLLNWIFRHITESRKQSLKTLSDWCLEYQDSASFKERIDNYFRFNESTFVLQHIAEHPHDYKQWFAVFYNNNKFITEPELMKLRDRLSRFLESFHNNPGLNFISGMVRAMLNDFNDSDGRIRFENAIKAVAEADSKILTKETHKDEVTNNDFIVGIIPFLKDSKLSSELLTDVSGIILHYFPTLTTKMVEEFNMPWLYNDIINENIIKLRNLNIKLYEQIGRI